MSLIPNFDRDLGEKRRTYQLVLDKRGYVEATVGERTVSFRVQEAG